MTRALKYLNRVIVFLLISVFVFSSVSFGKEEALAQLKAPSNAGETLGAGATPDGSSSAVGFNPNAGTSGVGLAPSTNYAQALGTGAAGLATCAASGASASAASAGGAAIGASGSILGELRSIGSSIGSAIGGLFGGSAGSAAGSIPSGLMSATSEFGGSLANPAAAGAALGTAASALTVWVTDLPAEAALASISATSAGNYANSTWQNQKDSYINCIFYTISRLALQAMVASVISWANNGFQGNPSFIQNPTAFLADVADQEIGRFLYNDPSGDYRWMCTPFSFQIKRAIIYNRSFAQRSECTLKQVVSNYDNFVSGVNNELGTLGDWNAWNSIATEPQNNPYGAYALANVQIEAKINGDINRSQSLLDQGSGFLSYRDPSCVAKAQKNAALLQNPPEDTSLPEEQVPSGDKSVNTNPDTCPIITPGEVIANQVNSALDVPKEELINAKQINELVGALMVGLLTKVFSSGGLFGLGSSNNASSYYFTTVDAASAASGNPSYVEQLANNDMQQFLDNKASALGQVQGSSGSENQYSATKNGSITRIENSADKVRDLIKCYTGTSTPPVDSKDQKILAASTTLDQIVSLEAPLQRDIAIAEINISNVNKIYDAISNLPYENRNQLGSIMSQFLSISSNFHYQSDVINAEYERDYTIPNTLTDVDTATLNRINACKNGTNI